jgi:hypothetical protein
MTTLRRPATGLLLLLLPAAALAGQYDPNLHADPSVEDCSVRFAPNLTQGAFRKFVREFGSVSAFKQASPSTTLGARRFAVDLEGIGFRVEEHAAAWNDTFVHPNNSHPLGSDLQFPMLRVRAGVTDNLDVGVFYTANGEANYGWLGVEAKYGWLRQGEEMPVSVSLRAAYTKTLYVKDMDMHALTADVAVGRTFWKVITPYAALGVDGVLARETSSAVALHDEAPFVPHLTAGLEARYWHVAVGGEVQVGALTSYQVRVSALF